MFDVTPTSLPQIKAGKLRPLGVTTTERLSFLPDVPTIDSFLDATSSCLDRVAGVPKGTPHEIIAILHRRPTRRCSNPNNQQRFTDLGRSRGGPNSPDELAKIHRGKYRRMDQDDQVCGHQAAVIWGTFRRAVIFRSANLIMSPVTSRRKFQSKCKRSGGR